MGYILQDDVNYIYEIINTLYYIKNEEIIEKNLTETLQKNNINPDSYRKKDLKSYYKFMNKIKNKIHIDDSILNMYFSNIYSSDMLGTYQGYNNIAASLLVNSSLESLKEYKNLLLTSSIEDFYESIFLNIFTDIENSMSDYIKESSKSYNTVIDYLTNNYSLNNDTKWYLSLIAKDPKKYIIFLIDFILNMYDTFIDCYKVFDKDKTQYISDFKRSFESDPNFIEEITGINADLKDNILLYPTMVNYLCVSYCNCFNKVNVSNTCMYFGWKFIMLKQHSTTNKDKNSLLHEQLKCLSDKSKFEIIQLLKIKPRYGQEIAKELNLTTATVSYHMNSLVLAGLVLLTKDNNKIYYSLNNDNINVFINSLNTSLNFN